jgi:hypothetical protein
MTDMLPTKAAKLLHENAANWMGLIRPIGVCWSLEVFFGCLFLNLVPRFRSVATIFSGDRIKTGLRNSGQ